jgi:hypothetical protein
MQDIFKQMFRLDFGKLRIAAGLGYAASVLLVWYLMGAYQNMAYIAGIMALLIWISDVPGTLVERLRGMAACVAACVLFSILTYLLGGGFWPHVILLFIASFLGTAVLVLGTRAFLVGWVFIIWAIVAPLFQVIGDVESTLAGLVSGGAVVMAVALLMHFIRSRFGRPDTTRTGPGWREILAANPDWKFATFGYAATVAIVMSVTAAIGWKSEVTDPSWVANAALMVIGANPKVLGIMAVQRAFGTILGILVGFWLVQVIPGFGLLIFATFLVSFLIVATMDVNYVLLAFSWTVFMSLEWSLKGLEHVRTASLDRVAAEFLGIGIAVAAVFLWSALENRRKARVGKK